MRRSHHVGRDRRRHLVVLVAVAAVDVAAADRDDLDEQRVSRIRRARARTPAADRSFRLAVVEAMLQNRTRSLNYQHQASGTARAGRSRRTCSPIFTEPVKIDPTGMKPQSWCRATAARPADAMQPQLLQSGAPPNWHGVILRRQIRRDASSSSARRRIRPATRAGRRRRSIRPFGASQLRIAQPQRHAGRRPRARGRSGRSRSADTSPICGV